MSTMPASVVQSPRATVSPSSSSTETDTSLSEEALLAEAKEALRNFDPIGNYNAWPQCQAFEGLYGGVPCSESQANQPCRHLSPSSFSDESSFEEALWAEAEEALRNFNPYCYDAWPELKGISPGVIPWSEYSHIEEKDPYYEENLEQRPSYSQCDDSYVLDLEQIPTLSQRYEMNKERALAAERHASPGDERTQRTLGRSPVSPPSSSSSPTLSPHPTARTRLQSRPQSQSHHRQRTPAILRQTQGADRIRKQTRQKGRREGGMSHLLELDDSGTLRRLPQRRPGKHA
ncbi:hypothetical protein F4808DRAFT_398556 [Astrocystis sublimbata]|nr:hypothetical protein F4808DRAFT_398556 [Astrocystis sublimbata]